MYDLRLVSDNHVRHYSICRVEPTGWEVMVEDDIALHLHKVYHDWHRVERTLALFEREVSELVGAGWSILRSSGRLS
jgi:hypothetical protein